MAALESNRRTLTAIELKSEARSQVLVDTNHSDIPDRGDIAKGRKRGRGRKWKGTTRNPGIYKGLNPALAIGTSVKGSIEARIDSAYLIKAVVQGEELKGLLYHVFPNRKVKQFAKVIVPDEEIQAADSKSKSDGSLRRKYRRKKFLTKDRNAPKKNRTGYNYFFAKERLRLKETFPEMRAEREISQAIGEAWNKLSVEQKEPYQELGVQDKERYRSEMREYVYDRLRQLDPLDEGFEPEERVLILEDGLDPFALDALSLKESVGHCDMPMEEDDAYPPIIDMVSLVPVQASIVVGA